MGKRKNGEGTWGEVTISGKKYKRYRIAGKSFYGKTEKEVKEKYQNWLKNEKPVKTPLNKLTLNEVTEKWLKSKEKHIKATTYDSYEFFKNHILKLKTGYDLGNMQIQKIKKDHIQAYIDYLATEIARSSIRIYKSVLRQIFDFAEEKGYVKTNPVQKIVVPIEDNVAKKEKEKVFLTGEDWKKLEEEEKRVYSTGKRYYGDGAKIVIFLLHTGLRYGEMTALRWKNVDMEKRKIHIVENAPRIRNRSGNGGRYTIDVTTPKRKSSNRYVPLSDKAFEILQYFEKKKKDDNDFVFLNGNGNHIEGSQFTRLIKSMLKNAGCEIQDASPHDLRHSFGSELIRRGVDIKVVSELMGHADIQTTYNIYIHILDSQKEDAVNVFNEL